MVLGNRIDEEIIESHIKCSKIQDAQNLTVSGTVAFLHPVYIMLHGPLSTLSGFFGLCISSYWHKRKLNRV